MASTKDTYPIADLPQAPPYDPIRVYSPSKYALVEGLDRNYELQENIPIDGAREDLRAYSPFRISLVPPIVFENVPPQEKSQLGNLFDDLSSAITGIPGTVNSFLYYAKNYSVEDLVELLSEPPPPPPVYFTEEFEDDIASIVLATAQAEWELGVDEAQCKCPEQCPSAGTARITEYIRSEQGTHRTDNKGYTCNSYKENGEWVGGAWEWCGHFVNYCYGAAGLSQEAKEH
ncbi:MAG: hypothetical protein GF334_11740, partial [Candidatus Altiarchaeales archaeon]|nr:hypothetical protein [Candidatus Altiarchaeales archaeon]